MDFSLLKKEFHKAKARTARYHDNSERAHWQYHLIDEWGVNVLLKVYDTGRTFLSMNGGIEFNDHALEQLKEWVTEAKTLSF